MMTLADLKDVDDGSFDQIVKEIQEITEDESERLRLLEERIIHNFVMFHVRKSKKEVESLRKKSSPIFQVPVASIPRKRRTLRKRLAEIVEGKRYPTFGNPVVEIPRKKKVMAENSINIEKKSLKRRLETQITEEGTQGNGKAKKQRKDKNLQLDLKLQRKDKEPTTPDIPQVVEKRIYEMGGTKPVLVIQKKLYDTDLNKNNNRFSVPFRQIKEGFLTEEEKKWLDDRKGMEVSLMDPSFQETTLVLKKWKMNTSDGYNLISKWNHVVKMNSKVLKLNATVQLWAFRLESRLCFALVLVKEDACNSEAIGDGASSSHSGIDVSTSTLTQD